MDYGHLPASAAALRELSELGPFFAFEFHPPAQAPAPPWRPVADLIDRPDVLLARIHSIRAALATSSARPSGEIELRVAASVAHLGLTARLLSPVLGLAVLRGRRLELAGSWWQPTLGGAFPLSIPRSVPAAVGEPSADSAPPFADWVRNGLIGRLVDAVGASCAVSPRVLWGNVASAVNAAALTLARERPDRADAALKLASDGLKKLPTERAGTAGPQFRRASCCLIYRIALPSRRSGVCGDCVLR